MNEFSFSSEEGIQTKRKGKEGWTYKHGLVETTGFTIVLPVRWMNAAHTPGRKEQISPQPVLSPSRGDKTLLQCKPLRWAGGGETSDYISSRSLSTRQGDRPRATPGSPTTRRGSETQARCAGREMLPSPQPCTPSTHPSCDQFHTEAARG